MSEKNKESLKLSNVTKKLGNFAIYNVSLEIEAGEYFVILGPTGAGKTVLLEAIAGFYKLDTGKIYLNQTNITALPPEKRGFGFVYQDYVLFPHLNVRENIIFGLKNKGASSQEIESKLDEIVNILGIAHLLQRSSYTLSGGEQQRVALARVLIMEPQVLLLDEPLSALDPPTKKTLQQELRRLHYLNRILTIHVTHDFNEAIFLADRIGIMFNGSLVQVGTVNDIFDNPQTREIEHFIKF